MKVLLAKSDKPAAEAIRAALKMCGCQVVSAATAGGCLAIAHRKEFDLLLIDLALSRPPGVDWDEVIGQLMNLRRDMKIATMASENTRDLELRIRRHGILMLPHQAGPAAPGSGVGFAFAKKNHRLARMSLVDSSSERTIHLMPAAG